MEYVLGVDVGTQAVRAGLFSVGGEMLASASREIRLCRPQG